MTFRREDLSAIEFADVKTVNRRAFLGEDFCGGDVQVELRQHFGDGVQQADAVFTMTVSSEATESGSIALSSLSGIVGELRDLILNTTTFVAEEDPIVDRIPPQA